MQEGCTSPPGREGGGRNLNITSSTQLNFLKLTGIKNPPESLSDSSKLHKTPGIDIESQSSFSLLLQKALFFSPG